MWCSNYTPDHTPKENENTNSLTGEWLKMFYKHTHTHTHTHTGITVRWFSGKESKETWVCSLGHADPMDKEMTAHSSNLAWEISWTEETDGLSPLGHKESDTIEQACTQKWIKFSIYNNMKRPEGLMLSEIRQRQILYTITYLWYLKYIKNGWIEANRNGLRYTEKKLVVTSGERKRGWNEIW